MPGAGPVTGRLGRASGPGKPRRGNPGLRRRRAAAPGNPLPPLNHRPDAIPARPHARGAGERPSCIRIIHITQSSAFVAPGPNVLHHRARRALAQESGGRRRSLPLTARRFVRRISGRGDPAVPVPSWRARLAGLHAGTLQRRPLLLVQHHPAPQHVWQSSSPAAQQPSSPAAQQPSSPAVRQASRSFDGGFERCAHVS